MTTTSENVKLPPPRPRPPAPFPAPTPLRGPLSGSWAWLCWGCFRRISPTLLTCFPNRAGPHGPYRNAIHGFVQFHSISVIARDHHRYCCLFRHHGATAPRLTLLVSLLAVEHQLQEMTVMSATLDEIQKQHQAIKTRVICQILPTAH